MVAVGSPETILVALSTMVGIAGVLGVAYTVFRSASEQRLRELDQQIIGNQNVLITQKDTELARLRTLAEREKERADIYRTDLTQRAAVDHLSELVINEEKTRRDEHQVQSMILKDILAQLKGQRGVIQ